MKLTSSSWLAIFIPFLTFLLFFRRFRRHRYNLPPGPKPWPIIGNLNLIGPIPHHSFYELTQKYGPIMHLKLGFKDIIIVSSANMAKAFLKTHNHNFSSRPKTTAGEHVAYNYSDILWAPYGPYWRQARKICFTKMFSQKSLQSSGYIRKEEMKSMLNELFISSGTTVLLRDYFYTLTLNIISRMVLGKKYVEKGQGGFVSWEEFRELLDEFVLLNTGVANIGDLFPWINSLDLQGYMKRMKDFNAKFDRFLEYVLDDHEEKRKGVEDYAATNMVNVLLQLVDDPTLEIKLQRHNVKALTQDLVIAAIDTTAITIEWAMSELLKNPKILRKSTEELDKVIGRDRWVEETDLVNLPYIEAIVKETLRLHPVASVLPPKIAMNGDIEIAGYDIPKGTQVIVNVWAIGRDPMMWDNPNEFYPERFIGKDIDVTGHHFGLLPFGAGRRICPGYPLALRVVNSSIGNLVHGFSWSLPDHMKEVDLNMEEICRLTTLRKQPLEAVVKPRLSSHDLY
ncbi:trimethyltridecatetraene synthase-like [Prosopis cineraria]|uniref:trimethyltridecatetraene synthase-like n=1 Tax=Prosopis cineraria TaxID=364024 RepID=UPI0024101F1C|nr:trimethyltridecatetraene synthase-like [Prosopis cineraria]